MVDLSIKHHFTSLEHPQTNGQVESANRVFLEGLKRRLDEAKGNWVEEPPHVLWAFQTTPHLTKGESPFRLTYGAEVVIPVEVGELTWKMAHPNRPQENTQAIQEELDLAEEIWSQASLREVVIKKKMATRFNKKVILRSFEIADLVLRRADIGLKNAKQGKLAPYWEGPYRVIDKTGTKAYSLEALEEEPIPRAWNSTKLKKYYS